MAKQNRTDTNARVAALLRELAAVQPTRQKKWAYRRAADAVLALDQPLEALLNRDGTLRKIAQVGPSSERVILEVLRTGTSETVTRALADAGSPTAATPGASGTGADDAHFLSVARVAAILADDSLAAVTREDYRGDFQMHSTWSDGRVSIAEMARACRQRGYAFCAMTDHSYGLPIAHGVSMADLRRQHQEIDTLNRRSRGRFRIFKGIEANILGDGRLDMTADELAEMELVVASPHSALRSDADQTARMLAAISTPGVHILGHPRGRQIGSRPGITVNWTRVFERAAATGVAIEIDGDPRRQDVDYTLAAQAYAAGCFIAVDSDAHAPDELAFADIALAHARLAGLPPSRIVNCWPTEHLLEWMRLRSTASGR